MVPGFLTIGIFPQSTPPFVEKPQTEIGTKKLRCARNLRASVLVWSLALSLPVSITAQETPQEQEAQEGSMGMQGM